MQYTREEKRQALERFIEAAKLKPGQVAKACGLSPQFISQIMGGRRTLPNDAVERLCDKYQRQENTFKNRR